MPLARSLTLSLCLHLAILVVAIAFLASHQPPRNLPQIFTLVPPAASSTSVENAGPRIAVRIPTPVVTPPPAPIPAAPPASTIVQPVRPTPPAPRSPPSPATPETPRSAPVPKPSAARTTLAEFRDRHGVPSTSRPASPPARPASPHSPPVRISEDFSAITTQPTGTSATDPTAGAESGFLSTLVHELRAALMADGPHPPGLRATVRFAFRSDGTFERVTILHSSGHRGFDAAVLRAFTHARARGFRPADVGRLHELGFRSTDEARK